MTAAVTALRLWADVGAFMLALPEKPPPRPIGAECYTGIALIAPGTKNVRVRKAEPPILTLPRKTQGCPGKIGQGRFEPCGAMICWCSRCYRLRNLSSPPSKRLLRRAWGRCPKGGGGQDQSRRSLIFGSIKAASIALSTSSGCFSTSTFQSCREISSCPPPALSVHLPP